MAYALLECRELHAHVLQEAPEYIVRLVVRSKGGVNEGIGVSGVLEEWEAERGERRGSGKRREEWGDGREENEREGETNGLRPCPRAPVH